MNNLEHLSPTELAALQAEILAKLAGGGPILPPRFPRRRKKTREIQYLTPEETAALFKAIRAGGSARDLAIFEVVYHRGLRASEPGLLKITDLRPDLKRIALRRKKGSHGGEHLLTDREQTALRAWLRERGKEPGPLFPSRQRGAISRRRLDELMKQYGAAAGLPEEKRHMHALKHTCGTALFEQGVGVELVQDLMGHVNIQNTLIYAKVSNRRRAQIGEELRKKW